MTRKLRTVLVVAAVAVGLPLAALALATSNEGSGIASDALWQAIVMEESKGNPAAYNREEQAAGIAQIRPICLVDVNRISHSRGLGIEFALADRFSPEKSRKMWEIYLMHYGEKYRAETGRQPTDETFARIWNGGPTGWHKLSAKDYWARVQDNIK
jgi:hypothetical protein